MGKGALLFGLLMLGVGIGVGAVVFGSGPGELEPTTIDDLPPREKVGHVEEGPMLTGSSDASRAAVARAIDSVPSLREKRVEGEIEVLAQTLGGDPVADVDVLLIPPSPKYEGDLSDWQDKPLEETLTWTIARRKFMRDNQKEARTDANGKVQFSDLLEGEYRMQLSHPDYTFRTEGRSGHRQWKFKAGEQVAWIATKVTGLRLDVVAPDGSEAKHQRVTFKLPDGNRRNGRRNAKTGIVQIAPGTYEMTVSAGEDSELQSEPQTVTVAADEIGGPIRVLLKERRAIELRLDFGSQEARPIHLKYTRVPTGFEPDPDLLESRMGTQLGHFQRRTLNEERRHVLRGDSLEPGQYLVAAYEAGRRVAYTLLTLDSGRVRATLAIPEPRMQPHFTAIVEGPTGTPPSQPSFQLTISSEISMATSGMRATKTDDGHYRVQLPTDQDMDIANSSFILSTTVAGWGSQEVVRTSRPEGIVRFRFAEPATIDAEVKGLRGTLFEGAARIQLARLAVDQHRGAYSGVTAIELDSRGQGKATGVQPGRYRLELQLRNQHWTSTIHREEIIVKSGNGSLRLTMPDLMVVTVRAKPGVRVTMHRSWNHQDPNARRTHMHWSAHLVAGDEGAVKFAGVPVGKFHIQASGKSKEIEVRRDMEVSLLE